MAFVGLAGQDNGMASAPFHTLSYADNKSAQDRGSSKIVYLSFQSDKVSIFEHPLSCALQVDVHLSSRRRGSPVWSRGPAFSRPTLPSACSHLFLSDNKKRMHGQRDVMTVNVRLHLAHWDDHLNIFCRMHPEFDTAFDIVFWALLFDLSL
jgi:hypothetical protein